MRSLNERFYYKANEYRNLAFYAAFPIFYLLLDEKYLKNLLKYLIFIRILCQDAIDINEINESKILIDEFLIEYESLYGNEFISFNAHAHRHLPMQVLRHGPLNRTSCFPFENMFRLSKDLFHGTRNFEDQIAKNLEKRKRIRFNMDKLLENTNNKELFNFVVTNLRHRSSLEEDHLVSPKETILSRIELNGRD